MDEVLSVPLLVGARFRRREARIPPWAHLDYVADDWRGALVVIERGEIELCGERGGRQRFAGGAILFLDGLGVVSLHNPGLVEALVVGVFRRT